MFKVTNCVALCLLVSVLLIHSLIRADDEVEDVIRRCNLNCKFYAKCESQRGRSRCVCPAFCSTESAPVCGSDRRVYDNICTLKRTSCDEHRTIREVAFSECRREEVE